MRKSPKRDLNRKAAESIERQELNTESVEKGSPQQRGTPISGPPPNAVPATASSREMEATELHKTYRFPPRVEVGDGPVIGEKARRRSKRRAA